MKRSKSLLNIVSIFLLGEGQSPIGKSLAEQNFKSKKIVKKLGLNEKLKVLVKKEEDLLNVNICGVDGFVIVPYCSERFSSLVHLAQTKLPIIIFSEEETFCYTLDTFEYLSDNQNVSIAFSLEELKRKIKAISVAKWLSGIKVCLFDAGEWRLDRAAWLKNPIFQGKLNIQVVGKEKFLRAYRGADKAKAEALAKQWMSKAVQILEPSFEDVVKSAQVYLAMKSIMQTMKAKAAYVLWCGQFTKELGTKMCFALAKLADEGLPVGCWRGENLLPMLMLHSVSGKPVFVCEAQTRRDRIVAFRHCFAPTAMARGEYVLRRWRDMGGTVTAYCQLPKGEVTLVNCGLGDKIVVVKGKVLDCKDLGGDNCRMTVWVELEYENVVGRFVGREFAMVYGDYKKDIEGIGDSIGF